MDQAEQCQRQIWEFCIAPSAETSVKHDSATAQFWKRRECSLGEMTTVNKEFMSWFWLSSIWDHEGPHSHTLFAIHRVFDPRRFVSHVNLFVLVVTVDWSRHSARATKWLMHCPTSLYENSITCALKGKCNLLFIVPVFRRPWADCVFDRLSLARGKKPLFKSHLLLLCHFDRTLQANAPTRRVSGKMRRRYPMQHFFFLLQPQCILAFWLKQRWVSEISYLLSFSCA